MKTGAAARGAMLELVAVLALSAGVSCAPSKAHSRTAGEVAAAERQWSGQVQVQIRDYWNPWDAGAALTSKEPPSRRATTVLRIAIKSDGTADRPEILISSGISALDEAAIRAVAAAVPLPTPPEELSTGAGLVAVDLGFRVVGKEDPQVPSVDDKPDSFAVIAANRDYKTPGTVDPRDVQRTVETYRREAMTCLDTYRDRQMNPIGEVTVEFVITESGAVYRPIVLATRGLTRPLEGCLLRQMSHWMFSKPNGGAVKVAFPFRFWGGQAFRGDVQNGRIPPSRPDYRSQ
jgi:TonB family protein